MPLTKEMQETLDFNTLLDAMNSEGYATALKLYRGQIQARTPTQPTDEQRAELRQAVMEALGDASMCWIPKPVGIFDSDGVIKVGDCLIHEIDRVLSPTPTPPAAIIARPEISLIPVQDGLENPKSKIENPEAA